MALPDPLPPVLTCGQLAELLGYITTRGKHAGQPNRQTVRELVAKGELPPPIDPELAVTRWRWNLEVINAYIAGTWKPRRKKAS